MVSFPQTQKNRKVPPSPLGSLSEPDLFRLPAISTTTSECERRRSLTGGCTRRLPSIQVPCTPASPALKTTTPGHRRFNARSPMIPPTPLTCATPSTRCGDAQGGAKTPGSRVRFESSAITNSNNAKSRFVSGSFKLNSKLNYNVFDAKIVRKQEIESHLQAFVGMKVGRDGNVSIQEFTRHLEKHDPALLRHANSIYSTLSPGGRPLNFRALIHALYPAAKKQDIDALARMATSNSNRRRPASPPVRGVPTKRDIQYAMEVYQFWNTSGSGRLTFRECEMGLVETGLNDNDIDNALDEMFTDEHSTVSLKNFTVWFAACM